MKWVTREKVHVDRVACPWLIKRFVDPEAEFLFVHADSDLSKIDAIPFDWPGVELGHVDGRCSFESIILKYNLTDPVLHKLAKIVHAADTNTGLDDGPEGFGLSAVARGFSRLFTTDQEILAHESIVYDALYAYCQCK